MKAIGLGAGTAYAIDQDWSPSALATLDIGAAKTLTCLYNASAPLLALPSPTSAQALQVGQQVLAGAQAYAANNPGDHDLPTLTSAISAFNAAVTVANTAIPVAADPAGFLLGQREAVRDRVIGKLLKTQATVSDQQQLIQGYINSAQVKAASAQAVAAPAGTGTGGALVAQQLAIAGVHGMAVLATPAPAPTTAAAWVAELKAATQTLLTASQPVADVSSNSTACFANMPS